MPKLTLSLTPDAERKLRDAIAAKIGAKARKIVTGLHKSILERTPMNTGRTLGSWAASAGTPLTIDIADRFGSAGFAYGSGVTGSNSMPVGGEGSNRAFYESLSLRSSARIAFEQNPYQMFWIANGARLDSGHSFMPMVSDLDQGAGSRAAHQEYGVIARYGVFQGVDVFNPRGTLFTTLAVANFARDWRRHL